MAEDSKNGSACVVSNYKEAVSKVTNAKRAVAAILLAVVLLNVYLIYSSFKNFAQDGAPELLANLNRELPNVIRSHSEEITLFANDLSATYLNAFQEVIHREWPNLEQKMIKEGEALEAHGMKKLPEINKAISDIAISQEDVLREEVKRLAGENGLTEISLQYQEALIKRFEMEIGSTLSDHVDVSKNIGDKFEALAKTEPDITPKVDPKLVMGILLEMLGVKLQAGEVIFDVNKIFN